MTFFDDVELAQAGRAVHAVGGEVVANVWAIYSLTALLPPAQVRQLASQDAVSFIDQVSSPLSIAVPPQRR